MTPAVRNTRAEIKRVFSRHFARLGYEGLSLEAVAREVGIRKPSIYHHFPGGKETLYAEVTLDYVEAQATLLADALTSTGDLDERLVRVIVATADPSGETTSFGQRVWEALDAVDTDTRAQLSQAYVGRLLSPVEELFRAAIDSGTLVGVDAGLMGNAFLSMGRAIDLTPDAIEETAQALVDLFLNGARTR